MNRLSGVPFAKMVEMSLFVTCVLVLFVINVSLALIQQISSSMVIDIHSNAIYVISESGPKGHTTYVIFIKLPHCFDL